MPFKAIVAYDQNRAIGYKNQLLWKNKIDFKRMRNLVYDYPLIMGRKTFESIGKPFNEENNYVITRCFDKTKDLEITLKYNNVIYTEDIYDLFEIFKYKTAWIFGGEEIYKLFLPYTEEIYATEIKKKFDKADTFFPSINKEEWIEEVEREYEYFDFKIYKRKDN